MTPVTTLDDKLRTLRKAFGGLAGARLAAVETAELLAEDGRWYPWRDLPVRLFTDRGVVSVSWSKFDDLWVARDTSLPFSVEGSTVRWVQNAEPALATLVGGHIGAVWLGQDGMSIGAHVLPIWTRVFVGVGGDWMEIYNALDENGYERHHVLPAGVDLRCALDG